MTKRIDFKEYVRQEIERDKVLSAGGYDIEKLLSVVPDDEWTEVFVLGNEYGWGTIIQGGE